MTETPAQTPADAQPKEQTPTDQPSPGTEPGTKYSQEQMNDIAAKARESSERKTVKLQAQLDALKKNSMSDQEKAIDDARQEERDIARKLIERTERNAILRAQMGSVSPDMVDLLINDVPDSYDTPDDALVYLKGKYANQFAESKQPTPGIGGAQPAGAPPVNWKDDAIADAAVADGTYDKQRLEILRARAQSENVVMTIAPGETDLKPIA